MTRAGTQRRTGEYFETTKGTKHSLRRGEKISISTACTNDPEPEHPEEVLYQQDDLTVIRRDMVTKPTELKHLDDEMRSGTGENGHREWSP